MRPIGNRLKNNGTTCVLFFVLKLVRSLDEPRKLTRRDA